MDTHSPRCAQSGGFRVREPVGWTGEQLWLSGVTHGWLEVRVGGWTSLALGVQL